MTQVQSNPIKRPFFVRSTALRFFSLSKLMTVALAIQIGPLVSPAKAEETPQEIVAAQVRKQGHKCESPVSAVRDKNRSKPNGVVWTLTCAGTKYRVLLVPDQAAHIEPLVDGG